MSETLLGLQGATVRYGAVTALHTATVAIDEGEIVALLGPNGAGKSTVIKALFGLAPLEHGRVCFHEEPIAPMPHEMVRLGVSYVPQGRQVFARLTVRENLVLGGVLTCTRRELTRRMNEVLALFPALVARISHPAGTLSGGQQQMLALARGLMSDPKVLLLDEPTLGLSPKLVTEVFAKIKDINSRHNTAILVVEHNIRSLLAIAHRAYVLERGVVVATGTADEVGRSKIFEEVFLAAPTNETVAIECAQ